MSFPHTEPRARDNIEATDSSANSRLSLNEWVLAMARKKKPSLPPVGAAFAVPLEDGRYSVCRVLTNNSDKHATTCKDDAVLVAGCHWVGPQVPGADDPALRPLLYLTHHSWKNTPNMVWVSEEPPPELIPIGIIEPTAEEQATSCMSFGNWSSLKIQPLLQWKWDHERDEVLADDAVKQQQASDARDKARQERKQYLKQVTLEELKERQHFPNWKRYPPAKAARASRKLMTTTIEDLIALGSDASEADRMAILQKCIESFNELDAELQFIETIEREDICEEFEEIVHACGLGHHQDLADEWREW